MTEEPRVSRANRPEPRPSAQSDPRGRLSAHMDPTAPGPSWWPMDPMLPGPSQQYVDPMIGSVPLLMPTFANNVSPAKDTKKEKSGFLETMQGRGKEFLHKTIKKMTKNTTK